MAVQGRRHHCFTFRASSAARYTVSFAGAAGGEAERQVEARAMLREADTNEDGKISREEFYSLLKNVQAPDTLALYDHRLPPSKIEELAAKA